MELPDIHPVWKDWLSPVLGGSQFAQLRDRISAREAQGVAVYPPSHQRLRVFRSDPLTTRVVILGQDPYHGPGQAMGLSFSVPPTQPVPRSLRNIFKEIEAETGNPAAGRIGDLTSWEEQGVMLLNSILTVEEGSPMAHAGWGWESLTALALERLSQHHPGLVFMLWGGPAQRLVPSVDTSRHLRLATSHPSPLSVRRGFLGCGHFLAANQWLESKGQAPVKW